MKHHDLFIKYIGLLVMAVHWYNPLVYVMFHEISVISEMYCDSIVIGGKGEEERRKYSDLKYSGFIRYYDGNDMYGWRGDNFCIRFTEYSFRSF